MEDFQQQVAALPGKTHRGEYSDRDSNLTCSEHYLHADPARSPHDTSSVIQGAMECRDSANSPLTQSASLVRNSKSIVAWISLQSLPRTRSGLPREPGRRHSHRQSVGLFAFRLLHPFPLSLKMLIEEINSAINLI